LQPARAIRAVPASTVVRSFMIFPSDFEKDAVS
jgi:hypothetical protein